MRAAAVSSVLALTVLLAGCSSPETKVCEVTEAGSAGEPRNEDLGENSAVFKVGDTYRSTDGCSPGDKEA